MFPIKHQLKENDVGFGNNFVKECRISLGDIENHKLDKI